MCDTPHKYHHSFNPNNIITIYDKNKQFCDKFYEYFEKNVLKIANDNTIYCSRNKSASHINIFNKKLIELCRDSLDWKDVDLVDLIVYENINTSDHDIKERKYQYLKVINLTFERADHNPNNAKLIKYSIKCILIGLKIDTLTKKERSELRECKDEISNLKLIIGEIQIQFQEHTTQFEKERNDLIKQIKELKSISLYDHIYNALQEYNNNKELLITLNKTKENIIKEVQEYDICLEQQAKLDKKIKTMRNKLIDSGSEQILEITRVMASIKAEIGEIKLPKVDPHKKLEEINKGIVNITNTNDKLQIILSKLELL